MGNVQAGCVGVKYCTMSNTELRLLNKNEFLSSYEGKEPEYKNPHDIISELQQRISKRATKVVRIKHRKGWYTLFRKIEVHHYREKRYITYEYFGFAS